MQQCLLQPDERARDYCTLEQGARGIFVFVFVFAKCCLESVERRLFSSCFLARPTVELRVAKINNDVQLLKEEYHLTFSYFSILECVGHFAALYVIHFVQNRSLGQVISSVR